MKAFGCVAIIVEEGAQEKYRDYFLIVLIVLIKTIAIFVRE